MSVLSATTFSTQDFDADEFLKHIEITMGQATPEATTPQTPEQPYNV